MAIMKEVERVASNFINIQTFFPYNDVYEIAWSESATIAGARAALSPLLFLSNLLMFLSNLHIFHAKENSHITKFVTNMIYCVKQCEKS